jgi:hypothetical protein
MVASAFTHAKMEGVLANVAKNLLSCSKLVYEEI